MSDMAETKVLLKNTTIKKEQPIDAFSRFAQEVLSVDIQTDFTIEREKKNIDLLISDKNNAVKVKK